MRPLETYVPNWVTPPGIAPGFPVLLPRSRHNSCWHLAPTAPSWRRLLFTCRRHCSFNRQTEVVYRSV
ncbi:hypothetical protein CPT_Moabite_080 [Serratia phage Moabite]|uniref:Uncharacterized protein n=1 Tax=Serratia phage Moabite TaxID=2587814 RepID=A0A4Y5TRA8_9CAUD|nr:hypothetical protein HWC48_gp336 [Serratia phage Moabite]QDB71110.1 hypothetical protein CPT_Moabite_080 [Serratia phage Moabite]